MMTEPNLYGTLSLVKDKKIVRTCNLSPKVWTIGGSLSNDIRFLTDNDKLSSPVCTIVVLENGLAIVKNKKGIVPIVVNKIKLKQGKVLEPGDVIEILNMHFLYENDVLTKKKIKELSSNVKPGVLKIPMTPTVKKRNSVTPGFKRKQGSLRSGSNVLGFKTENISPSKLRPTVSNRSGFSTRLSKTPLPARSLRKTPSRLSVSTGKIHKFQKPTAGKSINSHIPVMNKPLAKNPSNRNAINIKLENIFDSQPKKTPDVNVSVIEISSTESTPAKGSDDQVTPKTHKSARRGKNSSIIFETPVVDLIHESSGQVQPVSSRRSSLRKSVLKSTAKKNMVVTPTNKSIRKLTTKCATGSPPKRKSIRGSARQTRKSINVIIKTPKASKEELYGDFEMEGVAKLINTSMEKRKSNRLEINDENEEIKGSKGKKLDYSIEKRNSLLRNTKNLENSEEENLLNKYSDENATEELDDSKKEENVKNDSNKSRRTSRQSFKQDSDVQEELDERKLNTSRKSNRYSSKKDLNNSNIKESSSRHSFKLTEDPKVYEQEENEPNNEGSISYSIHEEENISNTRRMSDIYNSDQEVNNCYDEQYEIVENISKSSRRSSSRRSFKQTEDLNNSQHDDVYTNENSFERTNKRSNRESCNQELYEQDDPEEKDDEIVEEDLNTSSSGKEEWDEDVVNVSKRSRRSGRQSFKKMQEEDFRCNRNSFTIEGNKSNVSRRSFSFQQSEDSEQEDLDSTEKSKGENGGTDSKEELDDSRSEEEIENVSRSSRRISGRRSLKEEDANTGEMFEKDISFDDNVKEDEIEEFPDLLLENDECFDQNTSRRSGRISRHSFNQSEILYSSENDESPVKPKRCSSRKSNSCIDDENVQVYKKRRTSETSSFNKTLNEPLRLSSMIKFSPMTPANRASNVSKKSYSSRREETSLFVNVSGTPKEMLDSSPEVFKTPNSVPKIPIETPKTPKSNVKSRKSVFLEDIKEGNKDDEPINAEKEDSASFMDESVTFTPKTPRSNRKVRISNNAPIGQPSIVRDLRKSIASPEFTTSPSGSFHKTPYSNAKEHKKILVTNVSTPKSNIKIRHSVTFEINTDDLQNLARNSLSSKVFNLTEVPNRSSMKTLKLEGSPSTSYSKSGNFERKGRKRGRSSINVTLPQKRPKIDEDYSDEEYDPKVLQDISNDSTFEEYEDCEKVQVLEEEETPKPAKRVTAKQQGFSEPKRNYFNRQKRASLPCGLVICNRENKSPENLSIDQNYSFISSTDTSSILFEHHPATDANHLLVNNLTLKSSGLDVSGVRSLTPALEKSPILQDVKKSGSKLSKSQKESLNVYENIGGSPMKVPRQQKEPFNNYEDVAGVKKLLKTSKPQKEPFSSYENIQGVKKLLITPKIQKEPANSYEDVRGVKKLLKTPKPQKEPFSSYENVAGVKKLLGTPKIQKEPANSYEDVRGVKKLLKTPKSQKEPFNSYENVAGVKKLLGTPKVQNEPLNTYEDVRGVKKLMKTPRQQKEPLNTYENVAGVKKLLRTPKIQKEPTNSYEDVRGVRTLLKTPKQTNNGYENTQGIEELFKTPLKTYSRLTASPPQKQQTPPSKTRSSKKKVQMNNQNKNRKTSIEMMQTEDETNNTQKQSRTRRAKAQMVESRSPDDEDVKPKTRRAAKKVEEEKPTRTTRRNLKKETIETDAEIAKEEETEIKPVKRKQTRRKKIETTSTDEEIPQPKEQKIEEDEIDAEAQETKSAKKKQTKRKKTEDDDEMKEPIVETTTTRQTRRRKITNDETEVEKSSSVNYETEDSVKPTGRSLRTRKQKANSNTDEAKKDGVDEGKQKKKTANNKGESETQDKRTPRKRKTVADDEEVFKKPEEIADVEVKTTRATTRARRNDVVSNTSSPIKETRKRTRKILSNSDLEGAASMDEEVTVTETRSSKRSKTCTPKKEEVAPVRKSKRQRK